MSESLNVRRFIKGAAKLLGLLTTLLVLPTMMAHAQGWAIQGQAVDGTGRPLNLAKVRVCLYAASGLPCSPTVTIWSDIPQAHSIPNPYTTDGTGNYSFVVNPANSYLVQVFTSSSSLVYSYVYTAGTPTSSGGTVTTFSAGNLSPLFTTSVATPTTTPALAFTLSNAAQNSVLAGPVSGGAGAPSYQTAPTFSAANLTNLAFKSLTTTGTSGAATLVSGVLNVPALELTGPVTTGSPGGAATTITPTGVTAGCTSIAGVAVCVEASGQVTSIGNAFSFTFSCTAAGTFEVGFTTANPNTCTYAYSNGTAASATLSDGSHSTVNLTTPFTSGALPYAYSSSTTFTGNATATNTQTASNTASFVTAYATFSGVGTGGAATGATASGSGAGGQCASETATLSGATATLTCAGLGNTFAGQSFSFNPSSQYVYLLLTGGCGHTLTVGGFTTVFSTQALTYTNIQTGSQTGMCIYSSPNPYNLPTIVVVASL